MNFQLTSGESSSADALELITQMVNVKISYHENKITNHCTEEDIKAREAKIKLLQQELYTLRQAMTTKGSNIRVDAIIQIERSQMF